MATHLTPDRRYLVVQGRSGPRLWRAANPDLPPNVHSEVVKRLMNARCAIRNARGNVEAIASARRFAKPLANGGSEFTSSSQ